MKITLLLCLLALSAQAQTFSEKASKMLQDKKYSELKNSASGIKKGDKDYAEAQYFLGRLAFIEEKWDDASEYFEDAIDANDKVAYYHEWLANTYGTIAGRANVFKQGLLAPKIKAEYEKTVALDPTNIGAYRGLIQYYSQAPSIMGGSMEKAHECADKIKKLNPAAGYQSKANIYVREKKFDLAEKEWKEAIKTDPTLFAGLIQFYSNQQKYASAFSVLDEAIKKTPDNMLLQYQYGRTSALSGEQLQRGEEYLRKYLAYKPKETEPSLAGANMRLGQILEKKGNKVEAKKYFQTAVNLDSNLKEAKEGLNRVK